MRNRNDSSLPLSLFKILFMYFSSLAGCFTVATESGLRIYNVEPLTQKLFLGKDTLFIGGKICKIIFQLKSIL